MNLVDLVKGQLGGDTISKLATMLGASPDATRGAIGAAIPTMLAGLGQISSTPDGARRLASAVDSADEGILGNFSQALSGNGRSLAESGTGMLSSLFGGGGLSGIGNALSRFTGLGSGAIMSLLGTLAPMLFGLLKSRKQDMGLDANGLANLLSSQKQNIASAIPAGLRPALGGIPGLSGLGDFAGSARDAAANAYDSGRTAVREGAYAATAGASNALRWALPLLGVALLLGLVWYLLARNTAPEPRLTTPVPVRPAPDPRDATLASVGIPGSPSALSESVTGWFKSATSAFSGITDSASAEAALPKLRELSAGLDTAQSSLGAIPESARGSITSLFSSSWNDLKPSIDKVMSIPGVSDRIRPLVEEITAKANKLLGR